MSAEPPSEADSVVVEEIDEMQLDPQELSQFVEASSIALPGEPGVSIILPPQRRRLRSSTVASTSSAPSESETDDESPQQNEVWIQKFMAGEISYNEYQTRMQPAGEMELEDEELAARRKSARKSTRFEKQLSVQRKDSLRGNLQGPTQVKVDGKTSMKRHRRFLPPALQGLMGQANLCYARGEAEMAKKLCLEIVRQMPLAHEPFVTLAQIYETEDPEKYLQFSLIAAHLNPSDVEQWVRIAEISEERGNLSQALMCYARAIKSDPKNFDLRMKRVQLLEKKGEEKQAFKCYFAMLPYIPKERGEFLVDTAKRLAKKFHEENNIPAAMEAMDRAYGTVSELFSVEDINLFLELLITTGHYRKALDVLMAHTNVEVHEVVDDEGEEPSGSSSIYTVVIPEDMVLDFRTKLAVVLVHLKCDHLFDMIVDNIFKNINVEEAGDCYLDVAESLMKELHYHYALKLLVPLITSENFSLAAVWLRYADCLRAIGDYNEAIIAYKKVVSMAQHLDARLTLSALLKQQGNYEEALKALEQDPESEIMDAELLYERCLMLKEIGHFDEFLSAGFMLLMRHCVSLRSRLELGAAISVPRFYEMLKTIADIKVSRQDTTEEHRPEFSRSENEPSVEMEWDLVLSLLQVADFIKNYAYFQKLVFTLCTAKRFQIYRHELQCLALLGCLFNRDPVYAYNLIRERVNKEKDLNNPRLWNLFNLVIMVTGDIRYNRYLMRLFTRAPVDPNVRILQANYHLNSGTYKYALNDYSRIYMRTQDPIHAMLIGVTLTQIACQKFTNKKQALASQAIGFMEKYRKHRPGELSHEIHYNIGRMYHQLGMYSLAVSHYKMALEFTNEFIQENALYLDLRAEIAYNLSSVYRSNNNLELARKYLYEYIEI